jgi:hypothetical protein
MTAMLLLFVFMGIFGGYSAGRLYKTFKARSCQQEQHVHCVAMQGGWSACASTAGRLERVRKQA